MGGLDADSRSVRRVKARNAKLGHNPGLEETHRALLAVDQDHILCIALSNELHDSLGVGVGTERQILDLKIDLNRSERVRFDVFLSCQNLGSDCTRHTETRHDDHVLGIWSPLLEKFQ